MLNFLFFFFLGPIMPKQLRGHGLVKLGTDLVVVGGESPGIGYSPSLYQMSCHNHNCKWHNLTQILKHPRAYFVAMAVEKESGSCQNISKRSIKL